MRIYSFLDYSIHPHNYKLLSLVNSYSNPPKQSEILSLL